MQTWVEPLMKLNCVLQISLVLFESLNWTMAQHWQSRVGGLLAVVLLVSVLNVQSKDDDDDKAKKESVGTVIGIDLGTTYSWSVPVNVTLILVRYQVTSSHRFFCDKLTVCFSHHVTNLLCMFYYVVYSLACRWFSNNTKWCYGIINGVIVWDCVCALMTCDELTVISWPHDEITVWQDDHVTSWLVALIFLSFDENICIVVYSIYLTSYLHV